MATLVQGWLIFMKTKKIYFEYTSVFLIGGMIYMLLELVWRGHTHWTMGICGGICFAELYLIEKYMFDYPPIVKCTFGSFLITANEFITGCIVNVMLNWNVWDYSEYRIQLYGQICLRFALCWLALCVPANALCGCVRTKLFHRPASSRRQAQG